jgi:hypothetical protein
MKPKDKNPQVINSIIPEFLKLILTTLKKLFNLSVIKKNPKLIPITNNNHPNNILFL